MNIDDDLPDPEPPRPRNLRQTAPIYRTHAEAADRRRGRRSLLPLSTIALVAVIGGAIFLSQKFQPETEGDVVAVADSTDSLQDDGLPSLIPRDKPGRGDTGGDAGGGEPGGGGTGGEPGGGDTGGDAGGTGGEPGGGSSHVAIIGEATELSARVAAILEKRCHNCHGVELVVDDFVVLDHNLLLDVAGTRDEGERYVVAGDLEASVLWQRAGSDFRDMPPADQPQLTESELADIRDWIETGAAPFPTEAIREQVPRIAVWRLVRDDLERAEEADRPFLRYFTFVNMHNHSFAKHIGQSGRNTPEKDIRLARAALSKLVNSLSYMPQGVVPKSIDDLQLVLRIDLRDYGWVDRQVWAKIVAAYPYGIDLTVSPDEDLRDLATEVTEMSNGKLPIIRGDWFIDTAPRPDLYYDIMNLPETVGELEKLLNVDPIEDFKNNKLKRAGFATSGVSQSNRLLDRHEFTSTRFGRGVYWKSYDFARSEDRGNLFKFPLGPDFDGNEFSEHAFEHDGGEMIFSLPNGLQAYYLGDGDEKRLNEGPVSVVKDANATTGSPAVVNAISCFGCHQEGMRTFTDAVRSSRSIPLGEVRIKVDSLYPKPEEMNELVEKDRQRFLTALRPLVTPFLGRDADQEGSGNGQDATGAGEPVVITAKRYQADLQIEKVAAELGFDDPAQLQQIIRTNSRIRELGLAPLAEGGTIKRSTWASTSESLFHSLALELEIGTPLKLPPPDLPEE